MMGMFDTFVSADDAISVQLKAGPCLMNTYTEGDSAPLLPGVYYGYEGVVVIRSGVVQSVTEREPPGVGDLPKYNKWGGTFDPGTEAEQAVSVLEDRLPHAGALEGDHPMKDWLKLWRSR